MTLKEKLRQLESAGSKKLNLLSLCELLRYKYYQEHAISIKNILKRAKIPAPTKNLSPQNENLLHRFVKEEVVSWGDVSFHLEERITEVKDLLELKPELKSRSDTISTIINDRGYLLSVLPLNLLMPEEVLIQFLPPEDFSVPHPTKHVDPYGITSSGAKVIKNNTWVASQKFNHTVLMNIHGHCPLGCSDCYKSYFVREKGHQNELGSNDLYEEVPTKLKNHVKLLVEWLNENPHVYDVIVSGGEPFLRMNNHIKLILEEFKKAKHITILRFCTGTIFLGLPFRIDDQLLNIIKDFSESSGTMVTFQAHLSNHFQISPEAVMAIKKISDWGFKIYSQIPIREGINFFSTNIEKTIHFLTCLVKTQFLVGVEPYKFIVDMHPRTLEYYVPIEMLVKVFGALFDSHTIPELERPKTLSLLTKQGNLILSWHSLFTMRKTIDYQHRIVKYRIPKVRLVKNRIDFVEFICEESLSELNEDPNSLKDIRNGQFE